MEKMILAKLFSIIILIGFIRASETTELVCPERCECVKVKTVLDDGLKVKCGSAEKKIQNLKSEIIIPLELQLEIVHLDLSQNEISFIEIDAFANFTNLKRLDLSSNALKQIDETTFGELDNLETIRLAQNQIVHIFYGSFERLKNLKQIDISSNPLACDCELLWLVNWTQISNVKLKPAPKCATPLPFKNQPLKKLKIGEDLHCESPLQPLLELKPDKSQLIFEGDSLTLRCRAPRVAAGPMRDSEDYPQRSNVFWGWSDTITDPNSNVDIVYHNPKQKFPSVIIDSKHQSDRGILDSILKIPFVTRNHSGLWNCRLVSNSDNLSRTITVLVISDKTKYCFAQESSSNKGNYSWPRTIRGKMVILPCVVDGPTSHAAVRTCNEFGVWEDVDSNSCPYMKESTRILEQFAKVNLTIARGSVLESARRLRNYTYIGNFARNMRFQKKIQDPMDVVFIGRTVNNYMEFIMQEKELPSIVLDIVSQVMELPDYLLDEAQKMDGTCRKLISAAELSAPYATSSESQKNNLAIELFKIRTDAFSGITCSWISMEKNRVFQCNTANKGQSLAFHERNIEASIQFPSSMFPSTLLTSQTVDTQRLLVSVYQNNKFLSQNKTFPHYQITSNIIGAKIIGFSPRNLSDPIFIVLKSQPFHKAVSNPKPVWWDSELNDGNGGWSLQGCHSSHYLHGMLVFACNKLGGYYGLIQHTSALNDFPEDEMAGSKFRLSPIGFYVGSLILFICMWILITTYVGFFDQIQMSRRIKHSLINSWFVISLLVFILAVGIFQTEDYKACQFFGISIHYLSLCVLLWICVGVSQFYKLISRHDRISMENDEMPREEPRLRKPIMGLYLVGYGIAVLVCGINSAVNLKEYASYYHCFLNSSSALGALFVPAGILLFFLLIMFICIRFHLRSRICQTHLSEGTQATDLLENEVEPPTVHRNNRSMRSLSTLPTTTSTNIEDLEHSPRAQLKAHVMTVVLYLTTWFAAALAVAAPFTERMTLEEEIFSMLYAISASILGVFLLFFYGVARNDVRTIFSRLGCCREPEIKDYRHQEVVGGSVFYHQPLHLRSQSQMSKQRPLSTGSIMLKSTITLNSQHSQQTQHNTLNRNDGTMRSSNFMQVTRQQNSIFGDAESTAEIFFNPNQSNVARRFFKKQKRLQKLNNIDVARRNNDFCDASSDISSTMATYAKPVSDMFGTSSKVNNTNINVDGRNNCKAKFSNPNILSDSCNESELFMDICQEGLRFSTLRNKINNTEKLANIYTNVPETHQPVHEVVQRKSIHEVLTMRADDKFQQPNNLNSPVEKNQNPLYVNARNIMDRVSQGPEEAPESDMDPMEPEELHEKKPLIVRVSQNLMNTVGLPSPPPASEILEGNLEGMSKILVSEPLLFDKDEEYISAPLEISTREFYQIHKKTKNRSKSMDHLDVLNLSYHETLETHTKSISFNNISTLPIIKDPIPTSSKLSTYQQQLLDRHMTSSLMMNRDDSPILVAPSLCDIGSDEEGFDDFSNCTESMNESRDDLMDEDASQLDQIFLNPDNTPNFSIFNSSSFYDPNSQRLTANFSSTFSDINYQNSELSVRSQDFYAPQPEPSENLELAEHDDTFNISDVDDDDYLNASGDFLLAPGNSSKAEFTEPPILAHLAHLESNGSPGNSNNSSNLSNKAGNRKNLEYQQLEDELNDLKDSQTSIDQLYEEIKRKASTRIPMLERPPIAPKPRNFNVGLSPASIVKPVVSPSSTNPAKARATVTRQYLFKSAQDETDEEDSIAYENSQNQRP